MEMKTVVTCEDKEIRDLVLDYVKSKISKNGVGGAFKLLWNIQPADNTSDGTKVQAIVTVSGKTG